MYGLFMGSGEFLVDIGIRVGPLPEGGITAIGIEDGIMEDGIMEDEITGDDFCQVICIR
jgi:hypothetical protein